MRITAAWVGGGVLMSAVDGHPDDHPDGRPRGAGSGGGGLLARPIGEVGGRSVVLRPDGRTGRLLSGPPPRRHRGDGRHTAQEPLAGRPLPGAGPVIDGLLTHRDHAAHGRRRADRVRFSGCCRTMAAANARPGNSGPAPSTSARFAGEFRLCGGLGASQLPTGAMVLERRRGSSSFVRLGDLAVPGGQARVVPASIGCRTSIPGTAWSGRMKTVCSIRVAASGC